MSPPNIGESNLPSSTPPPRPNGGGVVGANQFSKPKAIGKPKIRMQMPDPSFSGLNQPPKSSQPFQQQTNNLQPPGSSSGMHRDGSSKQLARDGSENRIVQDN